MPDLGAPIAWLTLEPGRLVFSRDGEELGRVKRVVGDTKQDIFEGLVIARGILSGDRWVDATQVEEIFERGVLLKIDAEAAERLPEPRL